MSRVGEIYYYSITHAGTGVCPRLPRSRSPRGLKHLRTECTAPLYSVKLVRSSCYPRNLPLSLTAAQRASIQSSAHVAAQTVHRLAY